ncbi:MAG: ABC transporter substrate-binding protein [Pseudomonas sp.]
MKRLLQNLSFMLLAFCSGCDAPNQAGTPAATRPVVDMAGRRLEVPREVERICTLGSVPVINTFVESLGAGGKIHNRPSVFHDIHGRWKMHKEFAPQLVDGPLFQSASQELLIENIIAARPDVCITMTRSIADVLERLGIPTLYLDWGSLDRMKASITLLGKVLNRQDRAGAYLDYFDRQMIRVRALSAQIDEGERRSVLYGSPLQLRCPEALSEEWIAAVGGRSVTRESCTIPRQSYDLEDLLRWNPEVIFLVHSASFKELKTNETLRNLSAIRNGDLILTPTVGHMWGGRTVEAPVASLWMLHKLYPQLISREELSQEIRYFYETFFDYAMSDERIAAIIDGRL